MATMPEAGANMNELLGGRDLHPAGVDLAREQASSLARPRMRYTLAARFFFWSMDLVYGKTITLPKVKLIEVLARIPYHAWEIRGYWNLTFQYHDAGKRATALELVELGRISQDNEFWHLVMVMEKIREDRVRESKFWHYFLPLLIAFSYAVFARLLAVVHLRSSYYFNAMFEDHAEHEYARFVKEHPELDQQPAQSEWAAAYAPGSTWGDVFRRVSLDERVHRNESLIKCGREGQVAPYADPVKAG